MTARKVTTVRRGASPYWFYRGLPLFYPIIRSFLPGGAKQLCATSYNSHHTFGRMEGTMRSWSLINPRLEPRLFSRPAARPGVYAVPVLTTRVCWMVYPGWYRPAYTRRCTPTSIPRGVYTRLYLSYPRGVYTRLYLSYPRV